MLEKTIAHRPVIKVTGVRERNFTDSLAIEEPLEIKLQYGPLLQRTIRNISVTMRTPGNDAELAVGFLFTEGIISRYEEIISVDHCPDACTANKENVILVRLKDAAVPRLNHAERNFYTSSSCGVCAKSSIDAIRTVSAVHQPSEPNHADAETLHRLPLIISRHQKVFANTGGLHASALFNSNGEFLLLREDVGRHNALDKLIGGAWGNDMLPLSRHILLLSGRASFELVQKAVMAGINIIAAVGAPSSLAVALADEFNTTLIGFLRDGRFNIYTGAERILLSNYENSYQR